MKQHVEITLSEKKERRTLSRFYRRLGLSTSTVEGTVRVFGTERADITRDGECIKVEVHPRLYRRIVRERDEMVKGDGTAGELPGSITFQDPAGNKVTVEKQQYSQIRIGILTSGGDAPGMNAVIQGCLKGAREHKMRVYGIRRGFQGLINDDMTELVEEIREEERGQGGTRLMTARCEAMKTVEGRRAAVKTLLKRRINRLVVVGGGGSFLGAMELWEEYMKSRGGRRVDEVKSSKRVDEVKSGKKLEGIQCGKKLESIQYRDELGIVCIPGTIDNDVPLTHSMGCDTAVQRIVEVVDQAMVTIESHHRILVVECMGRSSGWLTLMAAHACGADFVLLPEAPHPRWREEVVRTVEMAFHAHSRGITVFLCEGAIDVRGEKIRLEDVCRVIEAGVGQRVGPACKDILEVRTLRIGHPQRGGFPSARDRMFGVLTGESAVTYFASGGTEPICAYLTGEEVQFTPLKGITDETRRLRTITNPSHIFEQRDPFFQQVFRDFERQRLARIGWLSRSRRVIRCLGSSDRGLFREDDDTPRGYRIGILYNGPTVAGSSACISTLVQTGAAHGHSIYFFRNGFDGLSCAHRARVSTLRSHHGRLSTPIGRSDRHPRVSHVRRAMERAHLDRLIVIGDTKNLILPRDVPGVVLLLTETDNSSHIPDSNCTDSHPADSHLGDIHQSLGFDTALNNLVVVGDICRLKTSSVRRAISFLETSGPHEDTLLRHGQIALGALLCFTADTAPLTQVSHARDLVDLQLRDRRNTGTILLARRDSLSGVDNSAIGQLIAVECNCHVLYTTIEPSGSGLFATPTDRIIGSMMALRTLDLIDSGTSSGVITWMDESIPMS